MLTAIIDMIGPFFDTDPIRNQYTFFPWIFPFATLFTATLEMLGQISSLLKEKQVDGLIAHTFPGYINWKSPGDLLGAPAFDQLSNVVKELRIYKKN